MTPLERARTFLAQHPHDAQGPTFNAEDLAACIEAAQHQSADEKLGRLAYGAYGLSTGGKTYDNRDMPGWDALTPRIQSAWSAVARTVREATLRSADALPGALVVVDDEQGAWDRFMAAELTNHESSATQSAASADAALEERRKRFPKTSP